MEHLSRAELLALLQAARASRERDFVMILVAFSHGLRASEVVGMQRNAVRDGYLTVSRLKGSLRTVQPLIDDVNPLLNERKVLIEYGKNLTGNQRLFPITRQHFWRLMQRYAKKAGIPGPKGHPHVLKHSIAMQTIDSVGIHKVRKYLGHKSINSTGAYLKVTDAEASSAIGKALKVS